MAPWADVHDDVLALREPVGEVGEGLRRVGAGTPPPLGGTARGVP